MAEVNRVLDMFANTLINGEEISYKGVNLMNVDEINVYGGDEDIKNQVIGSIKRREMGDNPVGKKLASLMDAPSDPKISFNSGYHPSTPIEKTEIHGDHIRNYLAIGQEEKVKDNLPNITGDPKFDDQVKERIITALKAEYSIPEYQPKTQDEELEEIYLRALIKGMIRG
jgi:hypothetical protein